MLKEWDELPKYMKNDAVRPYYEKLKKKRVSLCIKRIFDVTFSACMLILLLPLFLVLSAAIAMDSRGGVFFRQERVTQYGRKFRIHKFRTMVAHTEESGTLVTVGNDARVTKIGRILRKYRLDELPQLIDVLAGNMSLVGTRPEVVKYVKHYQPEMFATLLLPAGVTSEASILVMDDEKLLENAKDVDDVYVNQLLPRKMVCNLRSLERFHIFNDLWIMAKTVLAVINKLYQEKGKDK